MRCVFIKITFIITRADDLGGAQVHVRDLAAALVERGEEVSVLAGGGGVLFDQLTERGVPFRRLEHLVHPIKPLQDWIAYREIKTVLTELKPDLVTTHSNKAGLLGRLAARSLQIPVMHTSHGFLFSNRPKSFSGRFYRLIEKFAAGLGNKVIAVSQSEFEVAQRLKVIPAGKITVVHNGLPALEPPLWASPTAEPPCLVMVARFAEPKDHRTLVNVLGNLKQCSWTLQLIGEGSGRKQMEELAGDLGIADRISFLGVRADVPAILAGSQIFVLSSKREGFPLSILEAMRAGLPVVASAVGGIGEAVVDGQTGFLVPAGNPVAMRESLEKLITEPRLRQKMGHAGRERFIKHFTLEQMMEKTLAVYSEINRGATHRAILNKKG